LNQGMNPSAAFRANVGSQIEEKGFKRQSWRINSSSESWKYFVVINSPGPIAVFAVRIIRSASFVDQSTSMTGARCAARAGGRQDCRDRQNSTANIGTSTRGSAEPVWGSDISASAVPSLTCDSLCLPPPLAPSNRNLLIEALGQRIQASFKLEPPAFEGKSRHMLGGVLKSLQRSCCLALQ